MVQEVTRSKEGFGHSPFVSGYQKGDGSYKQPKKSSYSQRSYDEDKSHAGHHGPDRLAHNVLDELLALQVGNHLVTGCRGNPDFALGWNP